MSIEFVELSLGLLHEPWHNVLLEDILLKLILEMTHISEQDQSVDSKIFKESLG